MLPLSLEQLIEEWSNDSPWDATELTKELSRIPVLHQKYTTQLTLHSLSVKMINFEIAKMRKLKTDYYNGRMNREQLDQLNWQPFNLILKTNDWQVYLDADIDLIKLNAKKALHEETVNFCTMIVKELNARTYQIRGAIDWEKFTGGQ